MGPGSVLGGRYALRHRLDDGADRSTWQAHDETLERPVRITVVGQEHPAAQTFLDAARRAAGVEDPRLVRVLDVGEDDGRTFVVTEWFEARTLADLVRSGPIPAEDARVVVGEACRGLEAARHRGLHHLRLRPSLVHRLEDGSVKVEGLATEAALAQLDVEDGDASSEQDTRDLVALCYAALTGYWPLDVEDDDRDLPPAPGVHGSTAAPSEIVGGVPADLDTLCAQTFAGDGPPATPADLAAQIAPWGRDRRTLRADGTFPHSLPPVRLAAGTPQPRSTQPTPKPQPTPETQPTPKTPPTAPTAPTKAPAAPTTEPTTPPSVAPAGELAPTAAVPVVPPTPQPTPPSTPQPPPTPSTPSTSTPTGRDDDRDLASSLLAFGRGHSDDRDDRDKGDHGDHADDRYRDEYHAGSTTLAGDPRHSDDPARRQSRTVLIAVLVFVALFLLLAWKGLSGLGDAFSPSPSSTAKPSATATSTTGTPDETPTTEATTTAPQGEQVAVSSASGFDPEGDGSEKDSAAGKAIDDDPDTSWTSDRYKSAEFGGLKKGVGLELDLGGSHTVTSVSVDVGATTGSTVQLREADGDTVSSTVLAEQQDASGTVTLKPAKPIETDRLVVWFTVPSSTDGGYRVEVAEVKVS